MFAVSAKLKNHMEYFFVKNAKHVVRMQKSCSVLKSYKTLLTFCFLCGFPYFPNQLEDTSAGKKFESVKFFAFICTIGRTFIFALSIFYDHYAVPYHSLTLTIDVFFLCSLLVIWYLHFKRRDIIHLMRMVISVTDEVSSKSFKSQFKVYAYVLVNSAAFLTLSTPVIMRYSELCDRMNKTSVKYLWHEMGEEYDGLQCTVIAVSRATTVLSSGMALCAVVMLGTTTYFHFGDIILNFGTELKRRFERESLNQDLFLRNMLVFRKIAELGQAINETLSWSVFLVYVAIISSFFTDVAMIRLMHNLSLAQRILILGIFVFALDVFFSLTLAGERIKRKSEELQDIVLSCSYSVIDNDSNEKTTLWFSMISADIKSKDLRVTAGMFSIDNHVILSVAGMLITYGVLISQMD